MEKMAFALIVVLWLVWLASAGKLVNFIKLATPAQTGKPSRLTRRYS